MESAPLQGEARTALCPNQLLPNRTCKTTLAGDCLIHKARSLVEDAARAHGIVAHFAVPHIFVGWHSNGRSVCLEPCLH